MFRRVGLVLLSGLLFAHGMSAQPGPGLFGDRRFRAPVANAAALPVAATLGEVRLTLDDGALHFWDGNSWEDVAGGGGSGEVNTASNLGGGIGLYSVKVGADLRFNSLAAADFDLIGNVVSIDDTKWAKDSELPTGDAPHSRTVTVDAGGLGDYTTISAALAFVATQARSDSTQWLIQVYPGEAQPALGFDDWYNYTEAGALTIPSFTTVQGVASGHNTPVGSSGAPIVQLTATSGTVVTMEHGSSLVNLQFVYYVAAPSAPVSLVAAAPSALAVLTNVSIWSIPLSDAFPVDSLVNSGSGAAMYLYDTSVAMGPIQNAAASAVVVGAGTAGTSIYGGRFFGADPCTSLMRSAGLLKLFWTRLDSGDCTYDISNSGGDVRAVASPYSTFQGVVTHDDGTQGIQHCKTFSGTGSPEGSVAAPVCASYWRRDGGAFTALYLKQSGSGNTGWVAVGSSAQALAANGANCSTGNVALGVDAAGAAECAVDDDVPESGDFSALALTGPVTSFGLATTIAADAVTLGSQTAGAYVAGATVSQGLALTGSEAGTLGLMDCAANEIPKRNGGDTAWECATDAGSSGGAGDVVGPVSSTDNALARFDSTSGKLLQNSTATLDDAGVLVLPDGTASATGFRFASMAAGTGLFGNGSSTMSYSFGGAARWNISNAAIYSQNGSYFYNRGIGDPVFMPGNADLDSGLGANASDDMGMWAGNGIVERWLRVTAGVWRSLDVGQAADTPQAATCADSGNGSPGALTINPTTALVYVTNSDADGCTVTLGETNVTSGVRVEIVVTSTAGGSVAFADTAGVTELAGAFSAGLYDTLNLRYVSDRWVETGRSDN